MENGRYGNANTDFRKLTLARVPMVMFDVVRNSSVGCGASAAALLTGVSPAEIRKANKWKDHYSDKFLLTFLRKHGIRSFKVTKCNLTGRTKNEQGDLYGYIGPNNLVLTSQMVKKNEASWFVYWNGYQYHNFEVQLASFATILNFPIVTAYVLHNPKWK
jgi:hypothetical protein